MEENLATFVNVIIPVNLNKLYTYRVPKELEFQITIGVRVAVQFGSNKVFAAIVAQVHHTPPKDYEAKYINSILDNVPVVNAIQLEFWQWISQYYMCSIGDVMNAAMPASLKLQSKTIITLRPDIDLNAIEIDDKEYMIIEALELKKQLTIDEVSEALQIKTVMPVVKSMYTKGIIELNETLNEKYSQKIISCVKLNDTYNDEKAKELLIKKLEKNEKQLNVLLAFINLSFSQKHVSKQLLLSQQGISVSSLNTLVKKKYF